MAELILAVVNPVLERLADLFISKLVFCCGVNGHVEEMKSELQALRRTLKDASDAMQARDDNENFHAWRSEIREVADDLDDIIDTFDIEKKARKDQNFIKRCVFLPKTCSHQCQTSHKFQAIQPKISKIKKQTKEFLNKEEKGNSAEEYTRPWRKLLPNTKEGDFVGFDKGTAALVEELFKEEDGTQVSVVSIVGMAGSGKTTLAKHVYIRDDIKSHFDCCAWADVSKDYNVKGVMLRLLRQFKEPQADEGRELEEVELMEKLNIFLEQKRYLIVLDDVWTQKAWDDLKNAFPNGKIGSKVMLTSRYQMVAAHADPRSHPIAPEMLTEEQSWSLFCKKAFRGENGPEDKQKRGREMVGKCGGLPLAIVVLGGLLSGKTELNEWEKVYKNINSRLSKEDQLSRIMALSYNELSYSLKSCFLHLSLFPEDYRIKTRRLIGLWIAEGFVHEEGNETLEEVAENYLKELINRCMVQIAEMSSIGRVKACRVHDVLRDFSLEKAKEDSFCVIFETSSNAEDSLKKSRRIVIHTDKDLAEFEKFAFVKHSTRRHRSLHIFAGECSIYHFNRKGFGNYLQFICTNFKLLRVLDFEGSINCMWSFPREIGNLVHLRYLGLRNTVIQGKIPPSIGNLRMLETLDLFGYYYNFSERFEMPNVIWKMENLRCLCFPRNTDVRHIRIDNLTKLHTLIEIGFGSWMKRFSNFTNLVRLGINGKSREELEEILDFVAELSCLQILSLSLADNETFPSLAGNETFPSLAGNKTFPSLATLGKCRKLLKLRLEGLIEVLPNPDEFPPNLTTLTFVQTKIKQDPMPVLEKLPNLTKLEFFHDSYVGKNMVCSAKGFPCLQCLNLWREKELEDWIVEQGAMPSLQDLRFFGCQKLRMVPEGLRFITSLQELSIVSMPSSFCSRIAEGGEDWYKVRHIPSIFISEPKDYSESEDEMLLERELTISECD